MKNRAGLITCEEFERYTFPIPVNKSFGKMRNTFIHTELMKRHPCFSDEFCVDSKLRLGRKGLFTDVIVMNKLRFMLLRGQNSVAKLFGLRFENVKGFRFASIKLRYAFLLSLLCLLFCLVAGVKSRQKQNQLAILDGENETKNRLITDGEEQLKEYGFLSSFLELFGKISEEKNPDFSVNKFDWKVDGVMEHMNVDIYGAYPEAFQILSEKKIRVNNSVLLYKDGLPFFSLALEGKFSDYSVKFPPLSEDGKIAVRSLLLKDGCQLLEERSQPFSISFNTKKNLEELFFALGRLSVSEGIFLSSLKISKSESLFFVSLELYQKNKDEEKGGGIGGRALENADKKNLFQVICLSPLLKSFKSNSESVSGKVLPLKMEEKKDLPQKKVDKNQRERIEIENKVGEVLRENGDRIIYYKDKEGKMKSRLFKKEE